MSILSDPRFVSSNNVPPPKIPRECIERPRMIEIRFSEFLDLVKSAHDLDMIRKSYMSSNYTCDEAILKSVFGPRPDPEKKHEPAPDPTVLLAKVTETAEKAQRLLEEIQTERKAAAAAAANIHSIPASSGVSASEVGAIRFKEGT